jgi:hypothetical protein
LTLRTVVVGTAADDTKLACVADITATAVVIRGTSDADALLGIANARCCACIEGNTLAVVITTAGACWQTSRVGALVSSAILSAIAILCANDAGSGASGGIEASKSTTTALLADTFVTAIGLCCTSGEGIEVSTICICITRGGLDDTSLILAGITGVTIDIGATSCDALVLVADGTESAIAVACTLDASFRSGVAGRAACAIGIGEAFNTLLRCGITSGRGGSTIRIGRALGFLFAGIGCFVADLIGCTLAIDHALNASSRGGLASRRGRCTIRIGRTTKEDAGVGSTDKLWAAICVGAALDTGVIDTIRL